MSQMSALFITSIGKSALFITSISKTAAPIWIWLIFIYLSEPVQSNPIQSYLLYFNKILEKESVLNLPIHQIELFLQSDQLITKREEHAFHIIVKWVNKDLEQRKQYFPLLIKHVCLQFIQSECVVATIGERDFVKQINGCRDLVNDAILYYYAPTKSAANKPRRFYPGPDSVLILPYDNISIM